jgi:hypothetical protein
MWEWPFKTCFACNNANGDGCELVDEKNPPKWVDPPPSPSTKSSTAKATASTTTKCKTKKAISGTCISTTSCSNTGGVSEAGHCPGAANIQVKFTASKTVVLLTVPSAAHIQTVAGISAQQAALTGSAGLLQAVRPGEGLQFQAIAGDLATSRYLIMSLSV